MKKVTFWISIAIFLLTLIAVISVYINSNLGPNFFLASLPYQTPVPSPVLSLQSFNENFKSFNENYWIKADYTFATNKGYEKSENISLNGGILAMKSFANSYDGAGIQSINTYSYGSFSANIECPQASGTLCTFFLYQPDSEKKSDEIDIEIYNDGSRKVDLVTYMLGQKNNYTQVILPFDPSESFHEYRIDYYQDYVSFYIDGKIIKKFTSKLPSHPMQIMSNFWWPAWMPYPDSKIPNDSYMNIDWIKYNSKKYEGK